MVEKHLLHPAHENISEPTILDPEKAQNMKIEMF